MAQVQVDKRRLRKLGQKLEWYSIPWEFRAAQTGADVADAVFAAMEATNDDLAGNGPIKASAEGVDATPRGVAGVLSQYLGEDEVWAWFDTFAAHIAKRGLEGSITTRPSPRGPNWIVEPDPGLGIAFLSFLPPAAGEGDRLPAPDPAARQSFLTIGAPWTRHGGQSGIAWHGSTDVSVLASEDPVPALVHTVDYNHIASLQCFDNARRTYRQVSVGDVETASLSSFDSERSPEALIDELTGLAKALAAHVQVGCVRWAKPALATWETFTWLPPALPDPSMVEAYRTYAGLRERFVLDACGIQVLTSAHLERAHNLDDWTIAELTPDRYLVQAADLGDWFNTTTPPEHVIDVARHEFGPMMLTRDDVKQHTA